MLVWSFPSWGWRLEGITYIGGDLPSLLAQNIGPGYQEMNQLKNFVSRPGILSFNAAVLSLTYCYLKLLPLGVLFPLPYKGIKNNTVDRLAVEGKVSNPVHHCGLYL